VRCGHFNWIVTGVPERTEGEFDQAR
jgi:hypothetical protein